VTVKVKGWGPAKARATVKDLATMKAKVKVKATVKVKVKAKARMTAKMKAKVTAKAKVTGWDLAKVTAAEMVRANTKSGRDLEPELQEAVERVWALGRGKEPLVAVYMGNRLHLQTRQSRIGHSKSSSTLHFPPRSDR